MEIIKLIVAGVIFLAMAYVAFGVSILFGIIFFALGIYSFLMYEAWERPGVPILWLMGGLVSRVTVTEMLLPILKSETAIDVVVGLFAFGVVYLIGYKVKNG